MNISSSETEHKGIPIAQTVAAVTLVVGTNLMPLGIPYLSQQEHVPPAQVVADPFASATSRSSIAATSALELATRTRTKQISRWNNYVVQRLEELRAGMYDFTGLKVPSEDVIDRAWTVAVNLFRPDTPTPSVVPSEEGDVVFIWRKAFWDLEIDISSGESMVWAHNRRTGEMWSGLLSERQARASELLASLARQ